MHNPSQLKGIIVMISAYCGAYFLLAASQTPTAKAFAVSALAAFFGRAVARQAFWKQALSVWLCLQLAPLIFLTLASKGGISVGYYLAFKGIALAASLAGLIVGLLAADLLARSRTAA